MLLAFLIPILSTLLIGSFISGFYFLLSLLTSHLKERFTSSVNFENSDPLYYWVFEYLIEKDLITSSLSNLSCKIDKPQNNSYGNEDLNFDEDIKPFKYLPSLGHHFFYYKGIKIKLLYKAGKTILTSVYRTPSKLETLTLSCFSPLNITILKSLCEEAMNTALEKDKDSTKIYAIAEWETYWENVQSKKTRDFNTVILDSSIADEIINDIKNFQKSQDWYSSRGVPYRRGYLLYGPPGTGKTSFVLAVASELKMGVCPLDLSNQQLNDDSLNNILENCPKNSIILLEDIDAIFVERTSINQKACRLNISFSGLLNALDGVRSQEGSILFMSTNHIEKLDPALLRPGRIDVQVKLDYASSLQIERMYEKFYPDAGNELKAKLLGEIPEYKISMAKIQGHFLRHKTDAKKAVETAKYLIEISEYDKEMTIKEWLFRLGLEVLIPGFLSQHIRRVIDLKGISKGELVKMGVIKLGDQARILNMLKGDENTKKSFKLMSHQSIKALLGLSLKHLNEKKIIELVDMLPDQKITEFLLSDTLENKENYSKTIEEKIKGLVIRIEDFYNAKFLKKKENVKKYPKENPIELLERMKMGKYIEKFKENDVLEKEFFFSLDMGNLNEIGVNNIKARLSLLNEIKILKEECLEEEEITLTENNILKKSSSIQY